MLADFDVVVRLFMALLASALIGAQREKAGHAAGLRTHMLVCIGSTVLTLTSIEMFPTMPATIAGAIVTGIGFLGAGTIFRDKNHVRGLTTAASIWAVAGVGLAFGAGAYFIAIASTVAILIILELWRIEPPLRKKLNR
ncbi:MAG: MgtC/SapB family protein [Candidatus Woesearchaeota archaeon]